MAAPVTRLAGMRARAQRLLTDSCVIQTRITGSDGMGGNVEIWSASASIPCALMAARQQPGEQPDEARLESRVYWMVYLPNPLPVGVAVTAKDRIQIGARVFEVVAPQQGDYDALLPVLCVEVT